MRKGRISKDEERIISRLIDSMTPEDIAKQLDRDTESVDNFIKRKFKVGLTNEEVAAYSLEDRPYWIELKSQFTEEELDLFKYHWSRIIAQFKDDVFPTEELQVIDVIKLEILMNRCLKGNKDNIGQINTYDKMIQDERSKDKNDQDLDYIINLERQVASLRASQESLNRDYRELQTKKAAMLREMKGTREQRIKRLEDSKQSFTSWVASLMQDPELIKRYGTEMEKMRMAMNKERDRLSAFHKYEDGTIDQPFLTPDTTRN
jgi:DNA-binding CsgD family transcriptional regulator